ncbi:MAG TPA: DUF6789 family protein [Pyrinomonadaceae bacterium]|nr:DUF6789 family protein [Pyrinomonadaceae bacterium]
MNILMIGALAGLAATVPMTAAMKLMHRLLPREERYPLPPRRVTMRLAEKAGVKEYLDEPERKALTVAGHFAYGAAVGALYAPLARKVPLAPPLAGAAYGLAVWTVSYLGWLPAANLITPATEHPARRNALMIVAHLVWGAAAGALIGRREDRR